MYIDFEIVYVKFKQSSTGFWLLGLIGPVELKMSIPIRTLPIDLLHRPPYQTVDLLAK